MMQIPLSLYIHIPWCIKKCPYCDFNSHVAGNNVPENQYLEALLQDWQQQQDHIQNRKIHSIFIGGGTPSLMSAKFYEQLFEGLIKNCRLANDIEITLEANPGTLEQQRFADYRQCGINRISIGAQSTDDTQLKKLGRIHSWDEVKKTLQLLPKIGFDNFNVDIMYALPNQTVHEACQDLNHIIAFEPTHISWYQLTLEPNTVFYKTPPPLPAHDMIDAIEQAGRALLTQHGFEHYEISAYAKNDLRCKHNLNYWQFGDYIGIGAGAHGKITTLNPFKITRTRKPKMPNSYLQDRSKTLTEPLKPTDVAFEFFLNAFRLKQPIPESLFTERTQLSFQDIENPLRTAQKLSFIKIQNHTLSITQHGHQFLNDLTSLFL